MIKVIAMLKKGENVVEEGIINFCKGHLESYKKPRSVEFPGFIGVIGKK